MPFPPTPSQTASNTPTPSITASNTPTQTPSGSACIGASPTPTPSITATITPSRDVPTIYLHLCLPDVIPADGTIYACIYATSENSCTGATTPVLDYVSAVSDVGAIFDGEYISLFSTGGCSILNPGDTCLCQCYYELGPEASGYTLSAVTFGIFTTGTTLANYVHTIDCFTPECVQCFVTPTPTPTPSITPTITPTITPSVTPPCLSTNYRLFNETASPLNWEALDCAGNGVGGTILGGQQADTGCVQNGTLVEGSLTIVSSTPC